MKLKTRFTRRAKLPGKKNKAVYRRDLEFLPAALEVLETPQSPVRIAFLWFICVLATSLLAWGWFGKFDIVATAQGKIQPVGRVKIIESLEHGKTSSVVVGNGDIVEAGDIVTELDDTETRADEAAKSSSLYTLRAEILRRTSFGEVLVRLKTSLWQEPALSAYPVLAVPVNIPDLIRLREQAVLEADLRGVWANIRSLVAQRRQKEDEIAGLTEAIAFQRELVGTLEQRVNMRSQLLQSRVGSQVEVFDATQEYQEAKSALADKLAQLSGSKAEVNVVIAEAEKIIETASAENSNRWLEAQRAKDELEQELIKIKSRRERLQIRSPIDGVVQLSSITSVGQVVTANAELMRIVPLDSVLEIEAYLPNKDIGFVEARQLAIIKVEAYPYTRFGVLKGEVKHISSDAIPEPDAQNLESTIAQTTQSAVPTGNAQRVQNLVFPVTLALQDSVMQISGRLVPVTPGMSVTVEIKTGQRRILEYLFSPLTEIASEAMKER
ncbi:secretion protein HylD [Agrobacterium deltaense]|uniref:HlyD family type I secretion periplasmic adaptor subunit n=1 Tax=Agrobacterium TaxID=357 RepID=UPI000745A27F|nr:MULTISPECIES: HlyD family type I secretion periplasmic adaptor subunit [Agrobacterium]KVK46329.1 secretion protein HylD [Agrobacterium sp. D14]RKF36410.1 secretion protein HylD [Agrobacterium deltaense]